MKLEKPLFSQDRTIQEDGRLHGVIAGCQRSDGRWLVIRRSETVASPLKICFPGGGIDGDESQATAVIREMKEEVDGTVSPNKMIWHYQSDEIPLTLWGWHVSLNSGVVANPAEVAEILWLTPEEVMAHPDIMPRTDSFMAALIEYRFESNS